MYSIFKNDVNYTNINELVIVSSACISLKLELHISCFTKAWHELNGAQKYVSIVYFHSFAFLYKASSNVLHERI